MKNDDVLIKKRKELRRRIIVYLNGPILKTRDGIDVLPFSVFADQLAGNSLWL